MMATLALVALLAQSPIWTSPPVEQPPIEDRVRDLEVQVAELAARVEELEACCSCLEGNSLTTLVRKLNIRVGLLEQCILCDYAGRALVLRDPGGNALMILKDRD